MYSSLDRVDIIVEGDTGPCAVQTDHRPTDEIEATPEISTLFALVRVLNARRIATDDGRDIETVVYTALGEPPPFLVDALASVDATLERPPARERRRLGPSSRPPEAFAEDAFAALAAKVQRRVGLTDPAAALHALEAEVTAEPPDREDDEIGYWTRVLELAAMAVAVIRTQHPGRWTIVDQGDVPLGFALEADEGVVLPTNRAQRLIEDGEGETMFLLVGSIAEIIARNAADAPPRPILPSLRSASEVTGSALLWRPLLEVDRDDLPVIAYGEDSETTFSLLHEERHQDRADAIHAEAMTNIASQDAEVDEIEVEGLQLLAVSGSFFATEKLLDPAFMRELAARLGTELLAASVPRRGLLFVTSAIQEPQRIALLMALSAHEHDNAGGRAISAAVLLVQDGTVVGLATTGGGDATA
jgi:hypothetical protein